MLFTVTVLLLAVTSEDGVDVLSLGVISVSAGVISSRIVESDNATLGICVLLIFEFVALFIPLLIAFLPLDLLLLLVFFRVISPNIKLVHEWNVLNDQL